MTTEPHTLTDDDLRAMLAEVLHEHLAVRWVEGHDAHLVQIFGSRCKWWGYASYLDAPAVWSLLIYLNSATGRPYMSTEEADVWWVKGRSAVTIFYGFPREFTGRSAVLCPEWWVRCNPMTTRAWLEDFHARQARIEYERYGYLI